MKHKIICKHGNEFELESFSLIFLNIDCCGFVIEPTDNSHDSFYRNFWFIYSLNKNSLDYRDRIITFDFWNFNIEEFGYVVINNVNQKFKIDENLNTAQKQFDFLSKIYDNLMFY